MNKSATIETHQALQALEDLDDCARMDVGISATGPYDLLRRYIQQQDRLALSHAAGQDGEQCRAGAGEPVAWIRPDGVTTSDAGLMRHWEAQGLQFDPLIRALSRGVPEGMVLVPRVPTEAMCDAPGERGWAWKNEDEFSADDAESVYRAMIEAAIAAQRKEGE